MDAEKVKALEAAGFRVGDAADFLGLSDEERALVDLRTRLARLVRQFRESRQLSQRQLAQRIGSSQSRVARIEAAAPDVSLDLMFRGLFAAGGALADLTDPASPQEEHRKPGIRRSDTMRASKRRRVKVEG